SDSGVTIFPIGSLSKSQQLLAQDDVVFRAAFCDRRTMSQDITIGDAGTATDFTLSIDDPVLARAVTFSTTTGTTSGDPTRPTTVRVTIDTTAFQNNNGTTVGFIRLQSRGAVNLQPPTTCPRPADSSAWATGCIRLLINNREPDQRGTLVNVP